MKKILLGVVAIIVLGAAAAGLYVWNAAKGLSPDMLEAEYATSADRFLDIDGARVRVRDEGPSDAPPVILLHGFIFSLESWDAWAGELSADYRVIRYDLLGHGLTGPDPQQRYAPAERAAFIGEVMDALDIDNAVVGGNSLGGLAAWRFAATNPDRVDALILVAPGGYSINGVTDEPVEPPEPLKLFLRTAPEAGVEATLLGVFENDAAASAERVTIARDMMRRRGNGDAFVQSIEEFTLPAPDADLTNIAAPTLILWGEEDALIPVAHGSQFEAAIPNAELVVYDGVGHVPQEESPQRTAADARAFLQQVLGAAH